MCNYYQYFPCYAFIHPFPNFSFPDRQTCFQNISPTQLQTGMALSRSFQNLQVLRSVKSWSISGTNKCLLFECTRLLHSTQGTFSEPELKPSEDYPNPVLHKQKISPFVKDLFLGKFNKSLLSYAEILNDKRFLQLENNVSQGKCSNNIKSCYYM